jgi:hypothetical protein
MSEVSDEGAISKSKAQIGDLQRLSKVCVAFPTKGRAQIIARVAPFVGRQSLKPVLTIVSCVSDEDVAGLPEDAAIVVIKGAPGLAIQRNEALRNLPEDIEVLIFLDDDFLMHEDWIAEAVRVLESDSTITCVTGTVIADGIHGAGYSFEEGMSFLEKIDGVPANRTVSNTGGPYGCNMAFRVTGIEGLRFDERLVLYGWQEDRDFGGQIWNRGGRVVRINTALGVHLGSRGGRVSGRRLGYSQVINPLYLVSKKTMPVRDALEHVLRNCASNLIRSVAPEPHIDRLGRLRGNLIGIWDLLRGRLTPERAAKL